MSCCLVFKIIRKNPLNLIHVGWIQKDLGNKSGAVKVKAKF